MITPVTRLQIRWRLELLGERFDLDGFGPVCGKKSMQTVQQIAAIEPGRFPCRVLADVAQQPLQETQGDFLCDVRRMAAAAYVSVDRVPVALGQFAECASRIWRLDRSQLHDHR